MCVPESLFLPLIRVCGSVTALVTCVCTELRRAQKSDARPTVKFPLLFTQTRAAGGPLTSPRRRSMAIAAIIVALPAVLCAAAATSITLSLATCIGFDPAKVVDSYFPC